MEKIPTVIETEHKELVQRLKPLIDFMTRNNYSFLLLAGKDGTCTRHLHGTIEDTAGMLSGMMQTHKSVKAIIESAVKEDGVSKMEKKTNPTNADLLKACKAVMQGGYGCAPSVEYMDTLKKQCEKAIAKAEKKEANHGA